MKWNLLFIFLVLLAKSKAADPGNCAAYFGPDLDIDFSANMYLAAAVDDITPVNLELALQQPITIVSVSVAPGNPALEVLEAVAEDDKMIVRTFANFTEDQMDENIPKQTSTTMTLFLTAQLQCDTALQNTPLSIRQPIIDTNNHDPVFLQSSYEYVMPMPLVPRIDLTSFGDSIIARDIDFSNQDVTFTVSNDWILTTIGSSTEKDYRATLQVPQYRTLSEDTTLTITATDSGTPPRSSTATILIKVDKDYSMVETPTFTKSLYKYSYSLDNDGAVVLKPEDGEIAVSSSGDVTVTLDDKTYFDATYDSSTQTITLKSVKPVDLQSDPSLILVLTATSTVDDKTVGSAIIMIEDVPSAVSLPVFSDTSFWFDYSVDGDGNPVLKPEAGDISVKSSNPETTQVALDSTSDYKFDVAYNSATGTVALTLSDVIENSKESILTLSLSTFSSLYPTVTSKATILIKLPSESVVKVPQFLEAYYTATYVPGEDSTADSVTLENAITVSDNAVVTLDGDKAKFFSITYNDVTKSWDLAILTPLDNTIKSEGKEIVLSLVATFTNDKSTAKATLIIDFPKKILLAFSKTYYTAKYSIIDELPNLTGDKIVITDGTASTDVAILESSGSDYFSTQYTDDGWELVPKELLSSEILDNQEFYIVTLTASDSTNPQTEQGSTFVVIELPLKPRFDKTLYTADYKIDNSDATVSLKNAISVVSENSYEISVEDNYKDYFDLTIDSNPQITVKKSLDLTDQKNEILVSIQINLLDSTKFDTAIIAMQLPNSLDQGVQFVDTVYSAEYKIDGDSATVVLSKAIDITPNDNVDNFDFALTGNYVDNFKFDYSGETQLSVINPLSNTILEDNQEILLVLEAISKDTSETETTVIQLKLPVQETLQFKLPNYMFSYINDDPPTIDNSNQLITLTDNNKAITFTITPYTDNFDIAPQSNGYILRIKNPLSAETLDVNTDIVLTLEATLSETQTDFTTIVLNLPKKETVSVPQLTQAIYIGDYIDDTVKLQTDETIAAVNPSSEVTLETSEYSDNFALVKDTDSNSYKVTVTTPLATDVLNTQPDILLTLQAKTAEVDNVGTATLVIRLPKTETLLPATFSSSIYKGSYSEDGPAITSDAIELTGDNVADTVVTIVTGDFSSNFKLSESAPYTFDIVAPLNDDTLSAGREIVLVLEGKLTGSEIVSSATVIISLPAIPLPPEFSQNSYEGEYTAGLDGTVGSIKLSSKIETKQDGLAGLSVTIPDSSNIDYYTIEYNDETKSYDIIVSRDLLDTMFNPSLYITLEAKIGRSLPSYAVVIVNLVQDPDQVVPKFSNTYYFGSYADDILTIESGVPIEIISEYKDTTTIEAAEPYAKNFKFENVGGKVQGSTIEKLSDEILNKEKEIYVSLEAKLDGSTQIGKAVLIVSLPTNDKKAPPKFTSTYYTAKYSIDSDAKPQLTMIGDKIGFNAAEPALPQASLESYLDYFDITQNGDVWDLAIKAPLDDNTLKENTELAVAIKGVLDNAMDDTSATLLIKLPSNNLDIITFGEPYYQANYIPKTDADSIVLLTPIKLTDIGADISLESAYNNNFKIECSDTTCSLTVINNLDSSVLTTEKQILLVLKATTAALFESTTATVIVNLPLQTLEILQFTEPVYSATYKDAKTVTLDQKITLQSGDLDEINLELSGENKDSFSIAITGGEVVLSTTGLAQDIIDKEVSILLNIQATKIDDSSVVGTVPLVINLPKKVNSGDAPTFTQKVYYGDYTESSSTILLDQNLALEDSSIEMSTVTFSFTPTDYTFTTALKDDHWELSINTLPDGTIDKEIALILDVTANIPGKALPAETTIVVKLPKKTSPTSIYFEDNVYYGIYTHDTTDSISIDKNIIIAKDSDSSAVVTTDDYTDYFTITYKTGDVQVQLIKPLTNEILNKYSVITLNLKAVKDTESVFAAVIIELPVIGKAVGPSFTSEVYSGDYTESSNIINLDSGSNIALQDSSIDISSVTIKVAPNDDYQFTLTPKDKYWQLSVDKISNSILNTEIALLLEITADVPGESVPAETKVVIKLPKKVSPTAIYFGYNVYSATYDDTTDTITVGETIQIYKDDAHTATISIADDEYKDSFNIDYTDGKVSLSVKNPLSDDVLNKNSFITLTLQAATADVTISAGVIVQLPGTPEIKITSFSSNVYYGDYIESTDTVELDSTITLTDATIDISSVTVEVTPNSDFKFELIPQTSDWTLKVVNLPTDVIETEIVLALKIVAKIPGQTTSAETSIVIRLPKKISHTSIYFENTVYSASYTVDSNTATIAVVDDIHVTGKIDDSVSVLVIKDYVDYFNVAYDSGVVTISVKKPLSADILKDNSVITIYLSASKDDEVVQAAIVVTLPFTGGSDQPSFSSDVYRGSYLDSASNVIALDSQISLEDTTIDISTVTITVTPSNNDDFTVTLLPKDNYWDFLIDKVSNTIIDTEIVLVFTLTADIPDKTLPAEATVIISLPKKISATSVYFEESVYLADYVKGDKDKVNVDDDIKLVRDTDDSAEISLDGDYEDYFTVSYSNSKVTITLAKSLPDKVFEENTSIILKIKAAKDDEEVLSALVIKLPKSQNTTPHDGDSGDNTGLIAAVSVLAVLLVACIVGSVVFYYLKFKRGSRNYSNMDEPHFRKHSSPSDGKLRTDHPTRRPTGVIKLPLTDVVVTDSNTDAPDIFDRKKSVQFDTINTDELVIEPDEQMDEDGNEDSIYDSIKNEDDDENSTNL